MKRAVLLTLLVLLAMAQPLRGVEYENGLAAGAGGWGAYSYVAFEASNAQGTLIACVPEDPACRSYGTLITANDTGETMQGAITCLRISQSETFMAVQHGNIDVAPSAAYAAVNDHGEAVFALAHHAGSPCENTHLMEALRNSATPLNGGAVIIQPCDVAVCPYA